MIAKLRFRRVGVAVFSALALAGCSPEPLTPQEHDTLEYVHSTLPEHQVIAIKQNLRMTGLYSGELDLKFTRDLAEAINQVHFDLDLVEDRYQLDSEADAAGFLQQLSTATIRPILVSDLSVDPAEFVQTRPPGTEATREGRSCVIDGGRYSRNGETVDLAFYKIGRQAGIELHWDGWPSTVFPRLLSVRFGDKGIPLMVEHSTILPLTEARLFSDNGFWVTDAMKQATHVDIGPTSDIAPLSLPTGDLFRTAEALEQCR